MASYKSGTDSSGKPEDLGMSRRRGYMAPTIRSESRERGNVDLYGPFEPKRVPKTVDRSRQTSLPRLKKQEPLPSTMVQEPRSKTGLGFGAATTTVTITGGTQSEAKVKSSRNLLRRKASSVSKQLPKAESPPLPITEESGGLSPAQWLSSDRPPRARLQNDLNNNHDMMLSNSLLQRAVSPQIIPELDRYRVHPEPDKWYSSKTPAVPKLATHYLPVAKPPSPSYPGATHYGAPSGNPNRHSGYSGSGYSASPSTRYSESPGPGAYSRNTTPTSMSSQSSGIMAPFKPSMPRLKQNSSPVITRSHISRVRAGSINSEAELKTSDNQGLPALVEILTSSSPNSTEKGYGKSKEKKKGLSPTPPTPPPRGSSQKFKKERQLEESPTKPARISTESSMMSTSISSAKSIIVAQSISQSRSIHPVRPSREGTPNLEKETINVIQSNLTGINFSQNKRQSGLPRGTSPILSPEFQKSSKCQPSPSPIQLSYLEGIPASAGLGIIPDIRPPYEEHPTYRTPGTRTPSPSVSNPKSRFGFFGRRNRTAPEVPTIITMERTSRKGPAAGTGHEGYGKYAARGRSTSTGVAGRVRERSTSGAHSSEESVASQTHDPFFLERMSPVVIAGGGEIIENRNTSLDSNTLGSNSGKPFSRPTSESKSSSKTSLSQGPNRTTLWPSALSRENMRTSLAPKRRPPPDSSDEAMSRPTLALRRSMQRLNSFTSTANPPKPILIPDMGTSLSLGSLESSIISEESQMERFADINRGRKGHLTQSRKFEKRPKSPRKWNFFHRSQPADKSKDQEKIEALTVTVGRPPVKAVPHYALLDSSDENLGTDEINLQDILRDAEVVDLSNYDLDALQFGAYKENLRRIEDLNAVMTTGVFLPERSPIIFSSPEPTQTPEMHEAEFQSHKDMTSPKTNMSSEVTKPAEDTTTLLPTAPAPSRPSRLAQVGRIPKVISARPETTSPKSFSRPFTCLSAIHAPQRIVMPDKELFALSPSPPRPSIPEPRQAEIISNILYTSPKGGSETASTSHEDFLSFSPRKNSEATTTTISTSSGLSLLTTAVIPEPGATLAEDEVWDEYNDLMGEKESPSATSSHGDQFRYESCETKSVPLSTLQELQSPALSRETSSIQQRLAPANPMRRSMLTSSSVFSVDMSQKIRESAAEKSPTTPMSFGDFFSGYGDRNNAANKQSKPQRSSQESRNSRTSSKHGCTTSELVPISEQEDNSPASQVNLRIGSMTVSKWLTFGHVLFSPAREEMMQMDGTTKAHSILVIDGLGNDDWSFYASETYPFATFYNLSPTRPLSSSQRLSDGPTIPPNHRQVQYTSPLNKFPFPSSTFHIVVFRFPTAMSTASYANIISESKRVLKPGGYLELAVLDLDMLNMGTQARRAVRKLKIQMQTIDPATDLSSASDTVLKLVGKRGFRDVKSCNVGVPVASPIRAKAEPSTKEVSLASMLQDESSASDEGITKMVARVGRWWYTRCYESRIHNLESLASDVIPSFFHDSAVLQECETWNSSFKLVVAYAQKPIQGRRRTNSI
ncbi:hypothetical protein BJ878DRAFT_201379 [Calycina marina]|uniref:Methyltransferase type 11 domain-containing protein n=1 Tax=Calycina marina TaxID=1763456 RepID=A0A9P8CJA1_9HELO|nr:hypothetical protein BJ878DRAFT_201379 [Calycina marina]